MLRAIARRYLVQFPFDLIYSAGSRMSHLLSVIDQRFESERNDYVFKRSGNRVQVVTHPTGAGSIKFKIGATNKVTDFRARSFSSKEPETLKWLEKHCGEKLLFDIGANIGLYSIYFPKLGGGQVVSFECSPLNFGELVRNVNLNKLQEFITIVPVALSSNQAIGKFLLGAEDVGAAESSFENKIGYDGNEIEVKSKFSTISLSIDTLLDLYPEIGIPNIMKLDVDGNEEQILIGASRTLQNRNLVSILCEVNPEIVSAGFNIGKILVAHGFILELNTKGNNQIWNRLRP
jgi:FkbM family methyltransferase